MSNPFCKADHISYRKPGANRLEDGVLVIPLRQTWEGFFSFRSAEGAIIRSVPIDSAEWTAGHLWQIGSAVGLHGHYPWFSRSPEIMAMVQSRIRFEDTEPEAPPPAETETERRARSARMAAREAMRNTIRASLAANIAGIADIQEALPLVKPSVAHFLQEKKAELEVSIERETRALARLLA